MEMSNYEKEKSLKLLPCPCCNARVKYYQPSHHMEHFINKHTIVCPKCELRMENTSWVKLFTNWNNRKPIDIVLQKIKKEELCSQKGLDNAIADSIKNTKYGEVRGYNTSYNILDLCTKELEFINSDLYETFVKEMEEKQ